MFAFTDPEMIKQKVRASLLKPEPYSVFRYYKTSGLFQWVAKHWVFENTTLFVIALNAVYIAIDTDWNKDEPLTPTNNNAPSDAGTFFVFSENAFCAYFTFEWIIRFAAFEFKRNGLRDAWFVFDSILVFLMVTETWFFPIVMAIEGGGGDSPLGNAAILRLFRLLRLSRLLRMMRSLPELMVLIKGMMTAMKSVFYVMCLLLIVTYIFAIAFTQLAQGNDVLGEAYFSNVAHSMYSLLVYLTLLDNVGQFCDDLRANMWWLLILALIFICLAALTVMNMLIGVLCEVVSAVAATEKETIKTMLVADKIHQVATDLDSDFDNKVSYEEFTKIIEKPEALRAFEEVGVNPLAIVDFAELIFFDEGEPVDLTFQTFMDMVMDLRDSNPATVKDVVNVWLQIKTTTNKEISETKTMVELLDHKVTEKTKNIQDQLDLVMLEIRGVARALGSR